MIDLRKRPTFKGSYKLPIAGCLLVSAATAAIAITAPTQNTQGITGAPQAAGHSSQRVAPTPFSASARLAKLDELHAQVEEAKLRAALAKANSDAQVPTGAGSAMLAPPLPGSASSTNLSLTPPLPTSDIGGTRDAGVTRQASAPRYALIEAWGSGTSRQAIIGSSGSSRLVHIGDRITGGTITDINTNSVSYRDSRGKKHVID